MASPPQPRPNPYVGPRPFETGEQLYGRAREVTELENLLVVERVVVLHSPSGVGKTSLLQAALIPTFASNGFKVSPVLRVNQVPPWGDHTPAPNRYVFSVLLSLEEVFPLGERLPRDRLTGMRLTDYLAARWAGPKFQLLVFDQFEAVLTLDPMDREAKRAFFAELGEALQDRQRWALFALREDHLGELEPFRLLVPTQLANTFRLDRLDAPGAREAVQQPARTAGVEFTEAAAQRLIDELRQVRVQPSDGTTLSRPGEYVEPVQLQIVCHQIWQRLPPGQHQITEADLSQTVDVDSTLAAYYDDRVAVVATEHAVPERVVRDWFQRLVTSRGVRRPVLREAGSSAGLKNPVIESLISAHLVRAEVQRGAVWYELAHDRLIEPLLKSNAAWRQRHLIVWQLQAELWAVNPSEDLLLPQEGLAQAERAAAIMLEELTADEKRFLSACRAAAERARLARLRRQRFGCAILVSMILMFLTMVLLYLSALSRP